MPLESALLVKNGSQLDRLVEASIRQIVSGVVLSVNWKPLIVSVCLGEAVNLGGGGVGTRTRK